jgi:protein-tyrosine phosphatase
MSGVFNLRDVGGLATADGRTVATGLVFRSDGLHRAPADERHLLHELGVRRVIDLRTDTERETEGWYRFDGIESRHVPIIERFDKMMELFDDSDSGQGDDPLLYLYQILSRDDREALASVLAQLADSVVEGVPVVFHCTAGKDRTGMVAALLLSGLGVGVDQIAAEHARSAEPAQRMAAWYRANRGDGPSRMEKMGIAPEMMKSLLGAEASTMEATLAGIADEHGSVQQYLHTIGATGSIELLQKHLLVTR